MLNTPWIARPAIAVRSQLLPADLAINAVERTLPVGEAKVADQALRDAVGLQPGERGVLRRGFLAIEEFEAPDAQGVRIPLEVIAQKALAKGRGRRVLVVGVRRVIGAAQAELALCRDGVTPRRLAARVRRSGPIPTGSQNA